MLEDAKTQERANGSLAADGRGVVAVPGARLTDVSGQRKVGTFAGPFAKVVAEGVLVDKSLLVRDVLNGARATLFCRPRHFGKTLALSMLRDFFECAPCADPRARARFERLDIWDADGGRWRAHQGRYPVIALSLRDARSDACEGLPRKFAGAVAAEFRRHRYLLEDGCLTGDERAAYLRAFEGQAGPDGLALSVPLLAELLHRRHGERAMVLVDDCAAPATCALSRGFYREAADFTRAFLSGALGDGRHVEKVVLTGVRPVLGRPDLSGLEGFAVNTALDRVSEGRFGFTQAEVEALAGYLGRPEALGDLKRCYGGYRFGGVDVYNPWSVLSFFGGDCAPRPHWAGTAGSSVLVQAAASTDRSVRNAAFSLLEPGAVVHAPVGLGAAQGGSEDDPAGIWAVLYLSGYLTTDDTDADAAPDPGRVRRLRVPNHEVRSAFRRTVLGLVKKVAGGHDRLWPLYDALAAGDEETAEGELAAVVRDCAGCYDLESDVRRRAMMLGLLAGMDGYANAALDRGAGPAGPDIRAVPDEASPETPVLTIGVEFEQDADDGRLLELANRALTRIRFHSRDASFGDVPRVRWGVAFADARVAAVCERLGF